VLLMSGTFSNILSAACSQLTYSSHHVYRQQSEWPYCYSWIPACVCTSMHYSCRVLFCTMKQKHFLWHVQQKSLWCNTLWLSSVTLGVVC